MNPIEVARQFNEQGHFLAKEVFVGEQLERLTTAFDDVAEKLAEDMQANNARWSGEQMDALDNGSSIILHTHNIQSYSGEWMQALLNQSYLDVAEAILGEDIVLHHSKLFYKPPGTGSPFPMHQDWEHFPTLQDRMIAAVIHVNDATEASGCLRLYPASHKRGRLAGMRGEGSGSAPRQEYTVEGATPIEAEAGDVLFFSYLTVHGSTANRADQPRKTVLVQMHPGEDRVESGNSHTNLKLVLRGRNHHGSRYVMGKIR